MAFCERPGRRELWSATPAIVFVTLLIMRSAHLLIPIPCFVSTIFARIWAPFLPTLTLAEAEEIERQEELANSSDYVDDKVEIRPRWRTALFTALALIEVVLWFGVAILMVVHDPASHRRFAVLYFLTAMTWAYTSVRILHRPPVTPPYELFILGMLHLIRGVLSLGGQLYTSRNLGASFASRGFLLLEAVDLGIMIVFLGLILSLPLNVPRSGFDRSRFGIIPSPEDYTTLAGWMTFSWVKPLIVAGSKKTLTEKDVWDISPTLKTRPTFAAYLQSPGSSVLWKLLRANSMDLIIDLVLAVLCVFLNFAKPFFLRLILVGLENPDPGSRRRLYLYATLAFAVNLLKSQAELQHLWYNRRATSRIGTQLSAAIYDKALRISDQSGVVSGKMYQDKGPTTRNRTMSDAGKRSAQESEEIKQGNGKEKEPNADVGKIVNLMGIDCQKIMQQVSSMPSIYGVPFELVLSCAFLYNILGISAFFGFISLVFAVPLSQWLVKKTVHVTQDTLVAKDSRMKLVNEMFGAIKFIKFFAWENQWIKRIMKARDVEITLLKKARNINVVHSLVWTLVPSMVSILSFLVYVSIGHELNSSTAFTAIRLFDMLKTPLGALPYALINLAQTKVSLQRLDAFLDEVEVPDDVCSLARSAPSEPQELKLENATFRWTANRIPRPIEHEDTTGFKTSSSHRSDYDNRIVTAPTSNQTSTDTDLANPFELRNISLLLLRGKLTVVTGPTASGKTALLLALLGEIDRVSGNASIPKNPHIVDEHGLTNSIAYVAQTPWLQQLNIRDNIIFNYPLDQDRYDAVVEACALRPDFHELEDGDLTEIGSKGVSLSGGQKARVALARAVYAPTQYLILDDIFSAVDSHTARFLVDRLLRGPLVAHRSVLLVTHHMDLVLPCTHYVIQLLDGRVDHQGTVQELKQAGVLDYVVHDPSLHPTEEARVESDAINTLTMPDDSNETMIKFKNARKLIQEELRAEGTVKWSTYKTYLKASSYWTWACVLLGIIAAQSFDVGTRLWVSIWGNAYRQPVVPLVSFPIFNANIFGQSEHLLAMIHLDTLITSLDISAGFPDARLHSLLYVAVYCAIGVGAAIVAMSTQWVLFTGGLRGGRVLFRSLLASLSATTFRFYDTTPTGRILNRFGKDFDILDGMLPFMLHQTTTSLAALFAAVLTVIAVVPRFLPVAAVLAYCYVRLSIGYLATSRDLRRLESTSRSPILAGFSDLVDGIITVRAFSAEKQFLNGHYKRVDTTNRFWYFIWMLNRWLLLRFEILGAAGVYISTLFVLVENVSVGLVGLSIVSAMTFTSSVYWTCRRYTELELNLNSVERVVDFLDLPKEPPTTIDSNRVPAYWPSSSDSDSLLVVEDLEVKYAPELPSVLRGISFALKARERVGLLGRTGCGKSTLGMSLLRFVEPYQGRIIIDGIDIATIGTHDLRSRVTFIAQDQALFLGTVRDNLDPFNEHSDSECLDALARVHLITRGATDSHKKSRAPSRVASDGAEESTAASFIGSDVSIQADGDGNINLHTKVAAGGQNFSNGQRQLLAMARALLRQSGVVILDEATSSIDKATDFKLQATIRDEFHRSLLLTIAHRLETIIDFDRLIILENGRIIEFNTPLNLIQKDGGVFRDMCVQSGSFRELEAAAKVHAQRVR